MNKTWVIVTGIAAVLVIIVFGLAAFTYSAYKTAGTFENGIQMQYKQNQNVLSQYSNKIAEMAQVPSIYRDDFIAMMKSQIQARYGKDGSKAAFQWLKEHNASPSVDIYVKIQTAMEAGRAEFETAQNILLDRKNQYANFHLTIKGMVSKLLGYPRIDLAAYDIVTSDYSDQAFKTKKENGIKIR